MAPLYSSGGKRGYGIILILILTGAGLLLWFLFLKEDATRLDTGKPVREGVTARRATPIHQPEPEPEPVESEPPVEVLPEPAPEKPEKLKKEAVTEATRREETLPVDSPAETGKGTQAPSSRDTAPTTTTPAIEEEKPLKEGPATERKKHTEDVVLRVILNEQDRGNHILSLTEDGDVLLSAEDLKAMGFRPPFKEEEKRSLRSMEGVRFEVDTEEGILRITADPHLLRPHRLSLREERPPFRARYLKEPSLYVNYSLLYNTDEQFSNGSLTTAIETALRLGDYLFYSDFSYRRTEDTRQLVRMRTNLTIDDVDSTRRIVLGDFNATSGTLGSGGVFGGIKIERNFSLRPYMIRYPGLGIEGVLDTPSTVEVYVNERLVEKLELPPGEFQLQDLPVTPGAGRIKLLIRDVYGRERIVERPFYISSYMLRPGLTEYSLALGFRRENLGQESADYGRFSILGFYRRGIKDWLNAGIRGEFDTEVQNAGFTATLVPLSVVELNLAGSVSNKEGDRGYGGSMALNLFLRRFNAGLNVRGFSKKYADLSTLDSLRRPRFDGALRIGYSHRTLGSVSLTYSTTEYHEEEDRKRLSVYYTRSILGRAFLYITAIREKTGSRWNHYVNTGVNIPLGERRYASLYANAEKERFTTTASLYKNLTYGISTGYKVQYEREFNSTQMWRGYARVERNTRSARLSADYWKSNSTGTLNFNVAGSLVFIDSGVYLSRPIQDGFALVRTGLEGVDVRLNSVYMGKTSRKGELLVPGLTSYAENTISVSTERLPLEYTLLETTEHVAPYYRSGGVVEFEAKRLQAVEGRVFWLEGKRRIPAEFAGMEIRVGDKLIQTVTGKGGLFYIEDVPPGSYSIRLFDANRECRTTLVVRDSGEYITDAGEVTCRARQKQ